MKQFLILTIISFSLVINALAQEDSTMLLGKVSVEYIKDQDAHKSWFEKEYNEYQVKDIDLETKGISIQIFFGSWCGDSRRELPRFIKVLDELGFAKEQYEIIAVNRSFDMYKQSPNGEHKGKQIYRVPSFLIYKNEKQLNRITERPVNSLEEDLAEIVQENPYKPNYWFSLNLDDKLNSQPNYLKKLKNFGSEKLFSSSELLTYALSKCADEDYKKAIEALKFNLKISPDYFYSHKYLGIAYMSYGKKRLARKSLEKYLESKPDDKHSKSLLAKLDN